MTEKQLAAIEKKFGVALPPVYRHLLLNPPPFLSALFKVDDCHESQRSLFMTPKMLEATNSYVRAESDDEDEVFIFDERNPKRRWPTNYFVIGGTPGGDFFCLNMKLDATPVFFWQHDSSRFSKQSTSIYAFIENIFQVYASLDLLVLKCEE